MYYFILLFSDLSSAIITSVETSETTIIVTWSPADGYLDGYVLTCSTDLQTVYSELSTGLNATCEGLQPGTEHTITVTTTKSGWTPVESAIITTITRKWPLAFVIKLSSVCSTQLH